MATEPGLDSARSALFRIRGEEMQQERFMHFPGWKKDEPQGGEMRQIISTVAAVALAVTSVAAQDTNEKTKTKVSVDDGRAITMTGCLQQDATRAFTLRGATTMSSDEVTTRTQVKKDVDDDGAEVTRS